MIRSFGEGETRKLFEAGRSRRYSAFADIAMRKLAQLDAAHTPGNRLEALKGDRKGQYSIRINDQFRVCFRWTRTGRNRSRLSITTEDTHMYKNGMRPIHSGEVLREDFWSRWA